LTKRLQDVGKRNGQATGPEERGELRIVCEGGSLRGGTLKLTRDVAKREKKNNKGVCG